MPSFGQLLRQSRISAGLTQEELAREAKISTRTVSDLERGINSSARKETARLIADALRLTGEARQAFEAAARDRGRGGPNLSAPGHLSPDPSPHPATHADDPGEERGTLSPTHRTCKLAAEWLNSALMNHRVYFSRFNFAETSGQCIAKASHFGAAGRAELLITVREQNGQFILLIAISTTAPGPTMSRTTSFSDGRQAEILNAFLTKDVWPRFAPLLSFFQDL